MRRSLPNAFLFLLTAQILVAQTPKEPSVPPVSTAASTAPILAEAPANTADLAPPPGNGAVPAKISFSSCNVDGPYVALTFDDGPHAQNTPRLLDMLKQRGVHATFFVVGQNAAEYPEILKRIVAEGHELANHSYTHPILASMSESGLRDQLEKTHQAVLKATGVNMKVMRPPYGALSEPQRRWVRANLGYSVILWDVDPLDWKFRDASRVEQEILGHTRSGSIVLSHDIHKSTVDAMPATIDGLIAKGFKFATVSELLAMDKPGAAKPPAAPAAPAAKSAKPAAAVSKDTPSPAPVVKTAVGSASPASPTKSKAPEPAESADSDKTTSKKAPSTSSDLRQKWLQITNQR